MCGCGGGAAAPRVGRSLVTSGDYAAPTPVGETVPEAQALYRVVSADGTRYYATYRDAAQGQATHGGRLRTASP